MKFAVLMLDTSLNKSQKLVRILELLTRRGGVAASELMTRFELDARTLRRYLTDLGDLGLPVHDSGTGLERVVSIDPTYARTGVQLTLSEVLSLHFGRTLFTFLEGTSFAADLEGAIERLEPAIARSMADLVRDLDRKFLAVGEHAKDYRSDGDNLDEIVSALLYANPADAEYRGLRGVGKIYRLEPLTLATYRQGLYLFARDCAEDRIKTFAVERFARFSRLRREHFDPPPGYDPRDVVKDSFGIIGGPPEDIVADFTPQVAPYVRERTWHRSQRTEVLADGTVRLRLRLALGPELREWFLGFGPDVRVLAPEALVVQVRDALRAAVARYG